MKFVSLKRNTLSSSPVVLDAKTENPKNLDASGFVAQAKNGKIIQRFGQPIMQFILRYEWIGLVYFACKEFFKMIMIIILKKI